MPHSVPTRRSSDLTVFEDNPWRSTRGRTITFASIFQLKPTPRGKTPAERRKSMALPYVKGMDDAELAAWTTFDEVSAMRSSIFEDNAILIDRALARTGVRYNAINFAQLRLQIFEWKFT